MLILYAYLSPKTPKPLYITGVSALLKLYLYFNKVWCGKQDLKSETAVNNVQLCIIWFDYKTDLHNNSKYHAL